jgi:hypothetical protein
MTGLLCLFVKCGIQLNVALDEKCCLRELHVQGICVTLQQSIIIYNALINYCAIVCFSEECNLAEGKGTAWRAAEQTGQKTRYIYVLARVATKLLWH